MKTTPKQTEASADPVIREVRRIKEELARQHGFDVHRIAAAARAKQGQSGHKVVSLAKKTRVA